MMTLEGCLQCLRDHEGELRAHGIRHAAVCGCLAQGVEPEEGCIAILADFEPQGCDDAFRMAAAEQYLERLLDCRVELDSLIQMQRAKASAMLREAVGAF